MYAQRPQPEGWGTAGRQRVLNFPFFPKKGVEVVKVQEPPFTFKPDGSMVTPTVFWRVTVKCSFRQETRGTQFGELGRTWLQNGESHGQMELGL